MNYAVELSGVTKVFDGRVAVDNVAMQIPYGTIHGIVGANGAGKSTLLRMLIGLIEPTYGRIEVLGQPMHADAVGVRQRVHYVGTDGDLYRSFRVHDLLQYAKQMYPSWDVDRCTALLEALELPRNRMIRNLSLGMKMQLRLLVALSSRPDLLVLDEPTNGLDPVVKRQFLQFIVQEAANTGLTVLFATHQLEELERIADGVTVMFDGKAVVSGMLEELKGSIKRLQAVLTADIPQSLRSHPSVVSLEQSGQFVSVVVEGGEDEARRLESSLRNAGATYTELLDVGFDELFRYTMQKEGYHRDGILLS